MNGTVELVVFDVEVVLMLVLVRLVELLVVSIEVVLVRVEVEFTLVLVSVEVEFTLVLVRADVEFKLVPVRVEVEFTLVPVRVDVEFIDEVKVKLVRLFKDDVSDPVVVVLLVAPEVKEVTPELFATDARRTVSVSRRVECMFGELIWLITKHLYTVNMPKLL